INAAITSIVLIIGSVIMMFKINPSLAVKVVLIFPIVVFSFVFIIRKLVTQFGLAQKARDMLNRSINENIMASMLVRVFVSEDVEQEKFDERNIYAKSVSLSIVRIFSLRVPLINIANYAAIIIVIWFGGNLIAKGTFSDGELLAFYQYTQTFIFPLFILGFIGNSIGQTVVSSKRIEAVMDAPVEFKDGKKNLKEFNTLELVDTNLEFNEQNKKQTVLESISLKVEKRQKVGILGMTGSGKSMILQLILRFFEPTSGTIKINGTDLSKYQIQSVRSKIGLVFQENFIFSGTVKENLVFGNDEITDEEMIKAAQIAEVAEFVEKMPAKYDEIIGERGINLSGGQKQRLTIARALLGKPEILILDDSTSKLDSTTEQKIFENIKKEYPDLTIIIVAQKISSVKNSDRIYVIDEGRIEGEGTHEELKKSSFIYKEIELAQSNLADEGS
ncbi:ABC transporter ATP-binding protein, partial [Candidatus Dojkabacteria bacterium]|nr:ABC transporter ATP-binding protein [Candidatus Dojkabacteria bacterium]